MGLGHRRQFRYFCLSSSGHLALIPGIGKSIAWKLAKQGLNLVIVAKPEPMMDSTCEELETAFPNISVRKVPQITF